MMKVNDSLYTLVGRVLLGVLFLPAGLMKLMGFAGTAGYIASVGYPCLKWVRLWPSSSK